MTVDTCSSAQRFMLSPDKGAVNSYLKRIASSRFNGKRNCDLEKHQLVMTLQIINRQGDW